MHNKLKHKLIKYLEENFNAVVIQDTPYKGFLVYLHSDLYLCDLPTVVEAFNGELSINKDSDALVDKDNNSILYIINDNSPFVTTNQSILTIFDN